LLQPIGYGTHIFFIYLNKPEGQKHIYIKVTHFKEDVPKPSVASKNLKYLTNTRRNGGYLKGEGALLYVFEGQTHHLDMGKTSAGVYPSINLLLDLAKCRRAHLG
jgi:hypothetical protein